MPNFNEDIWDDALLSFDARIIRETAHKLNVIMPEDKRAFWLIVSQAIMRSRKANVFDREVAMRMVEELRK